MHNEKVIILDFGSQYTQLIARRVRELNIYSEIHPFNKDFKLDDNVKAVILSGSPFSVRDENPPAPILDMLSLDVPVLAICYGAQYLAQSNGGEVSPSKLENMVELICHFSIINLLFLMVSVLTLKFG